MIRKIPIIHITIFFFSISLISCKEKKEPLKIYDQSSFEVVTPIENSKPSQYDYKVVGTDENGDNVHGVINIEGKIGLGNIVRIDATNTEVVAEWVNKNTLLATDLEGYEYTLKIK